MKHTRRFLLIAVAAALAVFAVGCNVAFSTAKVDDAIMTTSVDADGVPAEEVVSFAADASEIYTSAKVLSAPDHTQIRIVWTYVTGNQKIDEVTLDSGTISDRYIYSNLTPTEALPVGDYQVQYFVDDRTEPDATVKFVVVAAAEKVAAATDGAYLEDVHMTSYMDAEGVPADTIDTVEPTGTWYVSAILRNTQPDTKIHFEWYNIDGSLIDGYDFDPAGKTDVYISGTLELTSIAPEGKYSVALFVDDATEPAATVAFDVKAISEESAASSAGYSVYSQKEGGFTIQYPSDWYMLDMKDSNAAGFYPLDYSIDGQSDVNTVVVAAIKGNAKGYTLDSALQAWIDETEGENLSNYAFIDKATDVVNGNDIAVYAYGWSRDSYNLLTMDYLVVQGDDLYVISYTGTDTDFNALYPYVERMVLSFDLL